MLTLTHTYCVILSRSLTSLRKNRTCLLGCLNGLSGIMHSKAQPSPSRALPKSSLTGGHVAKRALILQLSAKGTLVLQLLRKLFHSDVSAKNIISCSSCDQEAPPALLLPSFHLAGWLDDYKVRKNRACTECPALSQCLRRDASDTQALCFLGLDGAVAVGVGMNAQAKPGSLALFAYRPRSSRCESLEQQTYLHSRSPQQQES